MGNCLACFKDKRRATTTSSCKYQATANTTTKRTTGSEGIKELRAGLTTSNANLNNNYPQHRHNPSNREVRVQSGESHLALNSQTNCTFVSY